MAKYLVIVESPAKVKTIKKFLGSNYDVMASMGHVRDLPKSQLGLDFDNDYEPKYITIRGKGDLLADLRRKVKKADKIYLATDPDREGEAISWHLTKALKIEEKEVHRITFNEITKNAVKESLKHSRKLDMDLVDAQQARRILDRVVGYEISPLLWAKVKRGLSAGRVQSVALRLIGDREEEISAFIPEESWSVEILLDVEGIKKPVEAKLYGDSKGRIEIADGNAAEAICKKLKQADYKINEIKIGERIKKPPMPFTTSTLQQEASKVLNFSTQKTMRVAQQLYEGIELKGIGSMGLISYLRTDSVRISEEAQAAAKEYITAKYGTEYSSTTNTPKEDKGRIQDAHEAIRPTDINIEPAAVKDSLSRDQFRLYQLIWKRFAASQMTAAKYETTSIKIAAGEYIFSTAASRIVFEGFKSVYTDSDEVEEKSVISGKISQDTKLKLNKVEKTQHFSQPPAHFTEASLVKTMEELGIGRPSTYAPTITTILARRYVTKENKNLYMTEIGEIVNGIMKEAFPSIVDVNFTVNFESLLDGVEEGKVQWKTVIKNFYPDLHEAVENAEKELEHAELHDEVTDEVCELCGRNMVIKYGPHGKFLGCPGFPECRNTRPYFEKTGVSCPKCQGDIVVKMTKKGRKYYGCMSYPDCDFMTWQKPSDVKCPKCNGVLVYRGNKLTCSTEGCDYIQNVNE